MQGLSTISQLQSLELAHVYSGKAAELTLLTRLNRLTSLQLRHCTFISPLTSPDLGHLTTLQDLLLRYVGFESEQAAAGAWDLEPDEAALVRHLSTNFAMLKELRSCTIVHYSKCTQAAFLAAVTCLTALQSVELPRGPGDDISQTLAALSHLSSISHLSLADTRTLQVQAAKLFSQKPAFCTALVHLDVDACKLSSLAALSDLQCLTNLSASENPLTSFVDLSSFKQLRRLSLRATLQAGAEARLASEAWLAVAQLEKLTWLEFTAREWQLHSDYCRRDNWRRAPSNALYWNFKPDFLGKRLEVKSGSAKEGLVCEYGVPYSPDSPHPVSYYDEPYFDDLSALQRSNQEHGSDSYNAAYDSPHRNRYGHHMPERQHQPAAPSVLAQWSRLHHLHFSLDMLPDVAAARDFQRSLLSAGPHLSELRLVSSDGYKRGLGMVGVVGFKWVQEVDLTGCALLDTGCFQYFAALPGITQLVISDPMSGYDPRYLCLSDRQREMEQLKDTMDTWGPYDVAISHIEDSGIAGLWSMERSWDSRWDDAAYHRQAAITPEDKSSRGSRGTCDGALQAVKPLNQHVAGGGGAGPGPSTHQSGEASRLSGSAHKSCSSSKGEEEEGYTGMDGQPAVGEAQGLTSLMEVDRRCSLMHGSGKGKQTCNSDSRGTSVERK
jgi:hypothetical protein